jgi:hypothetical protein
MAPDIPGVDTSCPLCGKPMRYAESVPGDTLSLIHIYECQEHGRWRLEVDGSFRLRPSAKDG